MYKKYFFLLVVFAIGFSCSIKGMFLCSIKEMEEIKSSKKFSKKVVSAIKNEGESRYNMLNALSADQKELLKWEIYRQDSFMGEILNKASIKLDIKNDSFCSMAWHRKDSKLAISSLRGFIYIINMKTYCVETVGEGGLGIVDLRWTDEGLETRSAFGLVREWKKNKSDKWKIDKEDKWYSDARELERYLKKIKELNKKNDDGSLEAVINKDSTQVSIYNAQATQGQCDPCFTIHALGVSYLYEPQVRCRNTEIIKNIGWGPKNDLVVLRERASRCFVGSDKSGMEQVRSNEINIYSQRGKEWHVNEWHIIAKLPTCTHGQFLWSCDGNYLAFYDERNITLFPTRLFNMSLHQILYLYDHYKKCLQESQEQNAVDKMEVDD